MPTLFKQDNTAFGLDINDTSIKITQLERNGKKFKILGYTDFPLRKGILVNDTIIDEKSMIDSIHEALKKMQFGGVNTNFVVASIPEPKAFVRVIQTPKLTEDQAESAVAIESEQYIPIPLDQAYLDWQILRDAPEEKMDVLVTAAPKDFIDNFLRILKSAGLRPVALEVESAAIARALVSPEKKNKDLLILDISTFRSSLIVVSQGFLQFTSSVPIAGDAFTQSIARALGVSEADAEKIKMQVGLDESKEHQNVRAALMPVIDNLAEEIKNILKFHSAHSQTPISQILLCGGSSRLLHLSSYLYEKLTDYDNVDIILGNPWSNVFEPKLAAAAPLSREATLSYATSIGLAIRGAEVLR